MKKIELTDNQYNTLMYQLDRVICRLCNTQNTERTLKRILKKMKNE